jgi:hypothetical protein
MLKGRFSYRHEPRPLPAVGLLEELPPEQRGDEQHRCWQDGEAEDDTGGGKDGACDQAMRHVPVAAKHLLGPRSTSWQNDKVASTKSAVASFARPRR